MRAAKTDTEIRREQIAEAALALIADGGLSALSMSAIAERVGIVPSAVYRHYRGKDAVLDAVIVLLRSRLEAHVEAVCAESAEALPRLRGLLDRHVAMVAEVPAFPHVVFAHFSQAEDVGRWSRLSETMSFYLDAIAGLVEQGQSEGVIDGGIVPTTAAVMFIGLILPAAMLHRLSGGEFDLPGHVESAWPVFVRGISAGKGAGDELQLAE